jgi:hypothetical protein
VTVNGSHGHGDRAARDNGTRKKAKARTKIHARLGTGCSGSFMADGVPVAGQEIEVRREVPNARWRRVLCASVTEKEGAPFYVLEELTAGK